MNALHHHNVESGWRVLRAVTGHFDPYTVYVFKGQNTCVTAWEQELQLCRSLLFLNLSNCALMNINALLSLTSVKHLDISHNSIVRLDQINKLTQLENLRAVANPISRFQDLRDLSGLQRLRALSFQNVDRSEACPVCRVEDYRYRIYNLLPEKRAHSTTSKAETSRILAAQTSPRNGGLLLTVLKTRLHTLDGLPVRLSDPNALVQKVMQTVENMSNKTATLRDRIRQLCAPVILDFPALDECEVSVSAEFTSCEDGLRSLREATRDAKEAMAMFEKLKESFHEGQ
ncbi:leucine rich repeat-containing protein [Besnoitia besnoiti]|uniref:Leucine rich repeat-containing protein n=1 Tax=Besnoitia besnoiti TaxID=94643 RepID=A0A2A9MCB3_BESBE|nr:leucine rich repeat-containing protein [Besnoitia besnoiti]PFH33566.1 leucine rich repeat-containing protein [Besnoitia besnoiti]